MWSLNPSYSNLSKDKLDPQSSLVLEHKVLKVDPFQLEIALFTMNTSFITFIHCNQRAQVGIFSYDTICHSQKLIKLRLKGKSERSCTKKA
jgi:hypothetical protein